MIAFCHEYHPRLLKTYHNYKQSKEVEAEKTRIISKQSHREKRKHT
jgi:hypothetical protein